MTFSSFDHGVTKKIREWGSGHEVCWNFVAAYLIALYGVAAFLFTELGWLTAWWRIGVVVVIAYVAVLVVQVILKRERPKFETMGTYRMWWRTYSCPSGHATESAALATSLLLLTHFPSLFMFAIFTVVFIVLALIVGLGRLIVGVHYFTDVLAGFVLGIVIAVGYTLLYV